MLQNLGRRGSQDKSESKEIGNPVGKHTTRLKLMCLLNYFKPRWMGLGCKR
jgi:hypothetical protein